MHLAALVVVLLPVAVGIPSGPAGAAAESAAAPACPSGLLRLPRTAVREIERAAPAAARRFYGTDNSFVVNGVVLLWWSTVHAELPLNRLVTWGYARCGEQVTRRSAALLMSFAGNPRGSQHIAYIARTRSGWRIWGDQKRRPWPERRG